MSFYYNFFFELTFRKGTYLSYEKYETKENFEFCTNLKNRILNFAPM